MKNTAKLVGMILSAVLAMSFLSGCGGDGDDKKEDAYKYPYSFNPSAITTEFQTFYIPMLYANRGENGKAADIHTGGRWHFHNNVNNGDTIGLVIKKIFVNDKASPEGATVLYNFAGAADFAASAQNGAYGGSMDKGTITADGWTIERTDSVYEYLGNLGWSDTAGQSAYWGFELKSISATAKADNINLQVLDTNGTAIDNASLAAWFGLVPFKAYADPSDGDEPEPEPEPGLSTEWQNFYIKLSDFGLDKAINRVYFHAEQGGLEIQKVYVATEKSLDNATLVLDFTTDSGNATYPYLHNGYDYDEPFASNIKDGGTANGRYSYQNTSGSYVYGGNFGTGAAYSTNAEYYVFVARNVSTELTGNAVRLGLKSDAADEVVKTFAEWVTEKAPEVPLLGDEFATYYLDIATAGWDGVEGIHFHNKTDHELGIIVDRIFATSTKGTEEVVIQEFDGTDKSMEDDATNGTYYWSNFSGTSGTANIGIAAGSDNYAYIGGFATPKFTGKAYIGIVAKNVSSTVTGDEITLQPIIGGSPDDSKSNTFANLFTK